MNIDELTLGQLKEIKFMLNDPCERTSVTPWEIGKNYLIRTVTMIQTGRLVAVHDQELVIEDAAWIASTGRFADAIKSGNYSEVEPYPKGKVVVGRGAIIDACKIDTDLPGVQK